MFERFTDRARRVVVLAEQAARETDNALVGVDHLLVGLVDERHGVAAQVLREVEADREKLRTRTSGTVGAPSGFVPLTQQAKKSLELALREALSLGHNYIGTEHILLGVIRGGDSSLEKPEQAREAVLRVLRESEQIGAGMREGLRQGFGDPQQIAWDAARKWRAMRPPMKLLTPLTEMPTVRFAARARVSSWLVRLAVYVAPGDAVTKAASDTKMRRAS